MTASMQLASVCQRPIGAAQQYDILAWTETQIVGDVDAGDDEAEFRGGVPAQRTHAVQHLTALLLVHHGMS